MLKFPSGPVSIGGAPLQAFSHIMHLPMTSKHGFHDYEMKADAIEAAQARSSEASQGRARFLDAEPYSLGPQPGRARGHWLWATPPVGKQGELTSRGNPESSPRASRIHGRETGPTAKRGPESTARTGASLRCRAGGFHCVWPQNCARTRPPAEPRKGESRRGERLPGECEEWSCVGVPEGLWPVPRLTASLPNPPRTTVQQSLSGPPQPSPQPLQPGGGRSRRRRGASTQASRLPGSARGRARVTPHAGLLPGGHLGPGPAEHRGPVPWGECPQRVALGETRTPVLLLPRQTGPGVRGVWAGRGAAGLPPPMGNSLPGTWNERPSQATRPSSRQCAPSVQESRAGHPAASAARCHGLGEGRAPGVRAHC